MSRRDRLRVLSIVPFPPDPTGSHGGARAVGQLLAGSADRHRVALFCLRQPDEPAVGEALRARLDHVEECTRGRDNTEASRWRVRAGWLRSRPEWPTQLWSSSAAERLKALAERWRPDVIRVDYPAMAHYLGTLDGIPSPRVLVLYDPPLEAARNRAQMFGGRLAPLEVAAWRRFEQRALARADAVVVFTERDRRALGASSSLRVRVIPVGADVETPALDPQGSSDSLVFVGGLHHAPNADAATHLARELMPAIRRRRRDAVLTLVGGGAPGSLGGEGLRVTGRVPDLQPYLDAAGVVVAPLRLGGGMRIKVLDAIVAGKAVVGYPPAMAGLDVEDGVHVLIAGDEEAFVTAVCDLLDDPDRRATLGRSAREWAQANLGWERPLDAYDELYRALIKR